MFETFHDSRILNLQRKCEHLDEAPDAEFPTVVIVVKCNREQGQLVLDNIGYLEWLIVLLANSLYLFHKEIGKSSSRVDITSG